VFAATPSFLIYSYQDLKISTIKIGKILTTLTICQGCTLPFRLRTKLAKGIFKGKIANCKCKNLGNFYK